MKLTYIAGRFGALYSTESDIAAAFESLGWEVERLNEKGMTRRMLSRIEADLVLYTRWEGLRDETWGGNIWRSLANRGIPAAGVHLDLFWGLDRQTLIESDSFFRMPYVFTADGGHDKSWALAGVNHHHMPPAIAESNVCLGTHRGHFDSDVLFVGSRNRYHKQWPWRRELIDATIERYGDRFRLLGPEFGRQVRGVHLADAIASTKVVLGDSLILTPNYWSDRVPETLGRGGVLVHPLLPAGSGYHPNVDYAPYQVGDLGSVWQQIDRLLGDDEAREQMAWHGRYEVTIAHTYADRVRHIILPTVGNDWPHLRGPETILRMLARSGTTDVTVIDEVWRDDTYRLNGADLTGRRVLDIGANIGAFSLRAASLGATVIAVEPEPANRAVLDRAVALSGLEDRITVVAAAVGPQVGTASTSGTGGGVRAIPDPDGSIPIVTIDSLSADPFDFVKLDCEGCEADIVGDFDWHNVKRVVMEVHERNVGRHFSPEVVARLEPTHHVESYGAPLASTGMIYATLR